MRMTLSSIRKTSGKRLKRYVSTMSLIVVFRRYLAILSLIFIFTCPLRADKNTVQWQIHDSGVYVTELFTRPHPEADLKKIHVVRFEARNWRFEPHYFREYPQQQRMSSHEWMIKTTASLVINAGQYDTDFQHLGWFIHDSKNWGGRQHPIWKGILAGEPSVNKNHPNITIIDLQKTPMNLDSLSYRFAVQSLMLFDKTGKIRVNKSSKSARRCVIGEGTDGFIYLIVTETDWVLWDLAKHLLNSDLNIKQAISMDGGAQAQISIKSNANDIIIPRFQMALPCVICFYPK